MQQFLWTGHKRVDLGIPAGLPSGVCRESRVWLALPALAAVAAAHCPAIMGSTHACQHERQNSGELSMLNPRLTHGECLGGQRAPFLATPTHDKAHMTSSRGR